MKYSFHPKELNNWKSRVTERLIQVYIENELTPRFKKEGFDFIIFIRENEMPIPLCYIDRILLKGDKVSYWEDAFNKSVRELETGDLRGLSRVIRKKGEWLDVKEEEKQGYIERWKEYHIFEVMHEVPKTIKEIFMSSGLFPNNDLYESVVKLLYILKVIPDGLLFKLKDTGKTIYKRKAISKLVNK